MTHPLVLVSSAALGPSSWVPVAQVAHAIPLTRPLRDSLRKPLAPLPAIPLVRPLRDSRRKPLAPLTAGGTDCVVPDLRHLTDLPGPWAWRLAEIVGDAMGQLDDDGPVVLAVHSNAGHFGPLIATMSPREVACLVFVDAGLPASGDVTYAADPGFRRLLASIADPAGRLPRWSDWWPDGEMAIQIPDATSRASVLADQPRLPLAFFDEAIPVPAEWRSLPCGYLRFSDAYVPEATAAQQRGWPVAVVPGTHLHQVVDPEGVFQAVQRLVAAAIAGPG